jgi:hypothetical protein
MFDDLFSKPPRRSAIGSQGTGAGGRDKLTRSWKDSAVSERSLAAATRPVVQVGGTFDDRGVRPACAPGADQPGRLGAAISRRARDAAMRHTAEQNLASHRFAAKHLPHPAQTRNE